MLLGREEVHTSTVRKLSRAEVDQIPLVLYIPAPPGDASKCPTTPIAPPPPAVLHPVSSHPVPATPTQGRRFVFFPSRNLDDVDLERGPDELPVASPSTADDEWELSPSLYPFLPLPDNRAACAICIEDFKAPPQRSVSEPSRGECDVPAGVGVTHVESGTTEVRPVSADADALQLVDLDSSSAPEPLRLLDCGHVYHVSSSCLCADFD